MDFSTLLKKIGEVSNIEKGCTQDLLAKWKNMPPLAHKKVLINCHLTIATLILIELFLSSGAELKITCTNDLVCHDSIKDIIINLGIYLTPDEVTLEHYKKEYFDVVVDCGAYLANVIHPKKGFVELTHVEQSHYISTTCPIISVDSSFIKKIETSYGTGDGFVRAIKGLYLEHGMDFREKTYMVFGYGKVGQGICMCLLESGVAREHIFVVESSEISQKIAISDGFSAASIHYDQEDIKVLLGKIHCAVTATGVVNSISAYFTHDDFIQVEYLANMGTHDEWGASFPNEAILHNKQPLNFMLDYPTKVCYLDPVFALVACATLDIINHTQAPYFIIKKPNITTEKMVLDTWLQDNRVHHDMKDRWLNELEALSIMP